jgi:pyridoxamine 5'-phosphate oxidase
MKRIAETSLAISHLRKEYTLAGLAEADLEQNPFDQFKKWFTQAIEADIPEPTSMTLATSTKSGKPSARIVLLKSFDDDGFVFFSNYKSRKGKELSANPYAALVFHWVGLERQVRITGSVKKVSRKESGNYFHSRPAGSRIAAWASKQSEIIESRAVLEEKVVQLTAAYKEAEIPLPPNWGGYRVVPVEIEFWQGRPSRLHDRLCYSRQKNKAWKIERLSP